MSSAAAPSIDLRILGAVELRVDGELVPLGAPRERALLVRLALQSGRIVPVDRLIDDIWGDEPPDRVLAGLRVHVSRLRAALRRLRADDLIVTQSPGYRLAIASDALDVRRFERLVEQARVRRRAGDVEGAADAFREALALWQGPPLAELGWTPFGRAEATRLEEERLVAVEDLVDVDLERGHHAALVSQLESLTSQFPFRERLWTARVLALYRAGRQADALRAYQEIRRLLADELGIEPSPILRALEQAVLLQKPELDWVPPRPPDGPGIPGVTTTDGPVLPLPRALARPGPAIVGRTRELAAVTGWWERALAGRCVLAAISGDPGIGKTRMLAATASTLHNAGWTVLYGRSDEELLVAYNAIAEALEPIFVAARSGVIDVDAGEAARLSAVDGGAMGRPESQMERLRLFEHVVAVLRHVAAIGPIALVLDDVQWADRATCLLLRHVLSRLVDAPIFVLLAFRSSEPAKAPLVIELLADARRAVEVERLELRGLDEDGAAALIRDALGDVSGDLARDLWWRSGGNPLFLRELTRHVADGGDPAAVPEGVRDLVTRRLGRLSEPAQHALTGAAVVGRPLDWDLFETLGPAAGDELLDALEAACDAGLLQEVPGRAGWFEFPHSLVRDAIYETLPGVRRAALHRRVAEAVERRSGAEVRAHAPELARHFAAAGAMSDITKAVVFFRLAAEQAMEACAFDEAASHLRRAIDAAVVSGADDRERGDLLIALARAEARAGEPELARVAARDAAALGRGRADVALLAGAALAYDDAVFRSGNRPDGERDAMLDAAAAALDGVDRGTLAVVLARRARSVSAPGSDHRVGIDAVALARQALELAHAESDFSVHAEALDGLRWALGGPGYAAERLETGRRMVQLASDMGDVDMLVSGHSSAFHALMVLGDRPGAEEERRRHRVIVERSRDLNGQWFAAAWDGMLALLDGRLADVLAGADRLSEFARSVGDLGLREAAIMQRACVARETGAPDVLADLDAVCEASTLGSVRALRAVVLAERGDTDRAARAVAELAGDDPFAARAVDRDWHATLSWSAEAIAVLGDTRLAEPLRALLAPHADGVAMAPGGVAAVGPGGAAVALLDELLGDRDQAVDRLRGAVATCERVGDVVHGAWVRYHLGRLLIGAPGDSGRTTLAEAGAEAERIGLPRLARAVADVVATAPRPRRKASAARNRAS